ncbi:MAG: hypothetical protein U0359_34920 [Byssovorax sp.]
MLLLACVADHLKRDRYELRRWIRAVPKGGDGNLKVALRDDGADLAARGPLIAMFDEDKIRAVYGLSSAACKRAVLDRIVQEATGSPVIVLLLRNMEDLVDACCETLKKPKPSKKPKPAERDAVLQEIAAAPPACRDELQRTMPSFKRLVDIVCRVAGEATSGPA